MASQVEVDPQETREWLEALDAVVEPTVRSARSSCSNASSVTHSSPARRPHPRARRRT